MRSLIFSAVVVCAAASTADAQLFPRVLPRIRQAIADPIFPKAGYQSPGTAAFGKGARHAFVPAEAAVAAPSACPAGICPAGVCPAGVCENGVCTLPGAKTAAAPVDARAGRTALFYSLVRIHVAREAVKKGLSRVEAHAAAAALTNEVIDGAMGQVKAPVGVLGDGHLLDILINFLNSPLGSMLIKILLGLLGL